MSNAAELSLDSSANPSFVAPRRNRARRWRMSVINRAIEAWYMPLIGGPVLFAILRSAVRFGLISLLRRRPGLTAEELGQEIDLPLESLRTLLLGCVSMKLLRKRGDRYYCRRSWLMRVFDVEEPTNMLPVIEWMHQIVAPSMLFLEESLKEGRPAGLQALPGEGDNLYSRIDSSPELREVFYNAMNARTRLINEFFVEALDFDRFNRVLDVGGGDGQILEALGARYPRLKGTLLEIPHVAEMANKRFVSRDMHDRLLGVAGDMFREDFPSGHDCILFCHVNGNYSPEVNRDLLFRAYSALPRGGVVAVYSAFMNDDATGPLSSAVISAYFRCLVSGQGRQYSWREMESWLRDAGFQNINRIWILHNHGVIVGVKA